MLTTNDSSGRMTFKKLKVEIRQYLLNKDYSFLEKYDENKLFRALNSLMYDRELIVIFRAVDAIGHLSAIIFEKDPEKVRESLRRFFWSMNDESGTLNRYAPEAIGAILFNCPDLIDEYGLTLTSFLVEEPFEIGTRQAIARLAERNQKPFKTGAFELNRTLKSENPAMRAASFVALQKLDLSIPESLLEILKKDSETIEFYNYDTGEMITRKISDLISNP